MKTLQNEKERWSHLTLHINQNKTTGLALHLNKYEYKKTQRKLMLENKGEHNDSTCCFLFFPGTFCHKQRHYLLRNLKT